LTRGGDIPPYTTTAHTTHLKPTTWGTHNIIATTIQSLFKDDVINTSLFTHVHSTDQYLSVYHAYILHKNDGLSLKIKKRRGDKGEGE
jgi:hypothetical protein